MKAPFKVNLSLHITLNIGLLKNFKVPLSVIFLKF